MAWCLRAVGVRGYTKGSLSALSVLMRINSLRITLHSPMCEEFSFLSPHMRQRVPYWGVSPLSRVVRARWMMCLKWVCTSRGVRKVAVQREAASSQTWSFIFSLACHAALAGGCLRLRALRMRVRWRTLSWSRGMREFCKEYMSGCGNWVAAVPS
eukprot:scaffold12233_cov129-Isochrysis_galbana.AAC.1